MSATSAPARASSSAVARPMPAAPAGDERRPAGERDHLPLTRRPSSAASTSSTIRCSSASCTIWICPPCRSTAPRPPRPPAPPARRRRARGTPRWPCPRPARRAGRGQQVGTLAAGAVQHQQVGRTAQRLDLTSEDLVEAQIVPRRGDHRDVGRERDRGQRPPVGRVPHHVLGGEMLGVRRTPAVAAEIERPSAAEHVGVPRREPRDLGRQRLACVGQRRQPIEARFDVRLAHHAPPSMRRMRCIQVRRITSGGTSPSGSSRRMAPGLSTVSNSACV